MNKVADFLKDVKAEMSKVTWPSAVQTTRYTVVVIVISVLIALFLAIWDLVFQWILANVIL